MKDSLTRYGLSGVVFQWVLLTFACYRLQRIITADLWPPSLAFRNYVLNRTGEDSAWSELVTCAYCAGTYVTVAVYVLASYVLNVPAPVLQTTATMSVVGLLGTWDSRD